MNFSKYIDHTLLKATAIESDIIQLCNEAKEYNFYAVCVNSCYIAICKNELKDSAVKIASVIGFPLGAMDAFSKTKEAEAAVKNGADEIDMVINLGFIKDKKYELAENEIKQIKNSIGNKVLKVIIETCYLTDDEKKMATLLVVNTGADFVKTSTGFGTSGATLEDMAIIKSITQDKIQIKASGGIRDYETAKKYIDSGATRIGTSNGIQIVNGIKGNNHDY